MNKTIIKELEALKAENKKLKLENYELEKRKKYGLVWEDKPEIFDEQSQCAYPILRGKDDKKYPDISHQTDSKGNQKPHILIEGDNYHTLSVLNVTHQNKIDVIYIDPPYNTGNKDFKYNDSFVDKEDKFRHSKWLSFMAKRLKLAKNLLADDGVIFISIDDNEQANLKVLCDEIFSKNNFVECVVWDKKSSAKGVPPKNMIVNTHEYILVYQKSGGFSFLGEFRSKDGFSNPDNDIRGIWRNTNIKSTIKEQSKQFTITNPKTGEKYTDTWAFSKTKLNTLIAEECLIFPKSSNGQVRRKEFYNEFKNQNTALKSSWGVFDNQKNTEMLKEMLDVVFLNPKPLSIVIYIIKNIKNNSVILDFFAGSGTTAHAVLELNKQDGGNRQCILATNNESGICEDITYERVKKVMKGYATQTGKEVAGLGGQLHYLKTDFVPKDDIKSISDNDKISFSHQVGTMLALKENTFNEAESNGHYQIFTSDEKITGIYFNENIDKLDALLDYLNEQNLPCCLYAYPELDKEDFKGSNIALNEIPEHILKIYQTIGAI